MKVKGIDKLRKKIPFFTGKRLAIFPTYIISMVIAALAIFTTFDALPGRLSKTTGLNPVLLAFLPLIGELIVGTSGFILVYQMWFWKDRLKKKYGSRAYQRIFLVGLGGIIWVLTLGVNMFIPFPLFSESYWVTSPVPFLAVPMESFLGIGSPVVFWVRIVLVPIVLVIGFGMIARAFTVFGADYMIVLYLYFPEESEIQDNKIYSVLRHPTYGGALTVGFAGLLCNFTIYSLIFYMVFLTGFCIHIHFIEEKELIQRFGESYKEYRNTVSPFFVPPRKLGTLFRFLLGKE
ncbi:MAG: methyltransferase family protein [Promethearchaeota archaeon]